MFVDVGWMFGKVNCWVGCLVVLIGCFEVDEGCWFWFVGGIGKLFFWIGED